MTNAFYVDEIYMYGEIEKINKIIFEFYNIKCNEIHCCKKFAVVSIFFFSFLLKKSPNKCSLFVILFQDDSLIKDQNTEYTNQLLKKLNTGKSGQEYFSFLFSSEINNSETKSRLTNIYCFAKSFIFYIFVEL
jgi:hypothetical protein